MNKQTQKQYINELTPAQQAKFVEYRDKFIRYGLCTDPADRPKAEECIKRIYANAVPQPLPPPKQFIWVFSPMEGTQKALELMPNATTDEVVECGFGQHDASWLAFYAFFAIECNLESAKAVLPLAELCQYAGWWWPFDEACIICERPNFIELDEDGKVHSLKGQAIKFRDGFGIWAIHGQTYKDEDDFLAAYDKLKGSK